MSFHHQPKIVTDDLVFLVDFLNTNCYIPDAATCADLKNGYTGTFTGGIYQDGTILFDDSTPNNKIDFGNVIDPQTSDFTLGVWVNIHDFTLADYYGIIGAAYVAGAVSGFGLYSTSVRRFAFQIREGASSSIVNSPDLYDVNTWYYLTATRTYGAAPKLYVNGEYSNAGTVESYDLNPLSESFKIASNNSDTFEMKNGSIAYAHFNQKAFSVDEIIQNYNAIKSRFGL